ncbi:hypothetical protein [Ancylobacter sp. IITR112]|uniref:hypothetical protein n=1 Tax=Ancylobacter sp. IITR112 TaxID=3138073 RepID=UPI00352A501C
MHRYRLHGLTIAAPRAFPLLVPEPETERPADIHIRFTPWHAPAAAPVASAQGLSLFADGSALFEPAPGQRFAAMGGHTLLADLSAPLPDFELHTWLFGPPLGLLLHQRGLAPLHASVVKVGPVAVALAGHSGAGKSTLARAMIARGHGLLTDDLAVVEPGTGQVAPGAPAVRLWSASAQVSGDATPDERRVKAGVDKFHVPLPAAFQDAPAPLGLVLVIGLDRDAADFRLQRLAPPEAAAVLQHFLYRIEAARRIDRGRSAFAWSVEMARRVPVVSLLRTADMAALPDICAAIEGLVRESV